MAIDDPSQSNLEAVTLEKDRQRIFEAMASKPLVISALAADRAQFSFELDRVDRGRLFLLLKSPVARLPAAGEQLTIAFGLAEGQYFARGAIEPATGELFVLPIAESLYRMQRRDNFRAPVPESMSIAFTVPDLGGRKVVFSLADLSGGGLGLLAAKGTVPELKPGDALRGTLLAAGHEPIEIEAVIRHVWPPDHQGVVKVGVQCRNLGAERENRLVAIALQIHREIFSIFRGSNR